MFIRHIWLCEMKQPTEFIITSITDNGSPNNYEKDKVNSFTIGKYLKDVEFDENGKAGEFTDIFIVDKSLI